jgi:protein TonB
MNPSFDSSAQHPPSRRVAWVFGTVVCFHAAALWALNSGLIQRAHEFIKPPEPIMAELIVPPPPPAPVIEPPKPIPVAAPPQPVEKPQPRPKPPPPKPRPKPTPAPQPLASQNAADTAMNVPPPSPPAPPEPPPAPPAPPTPPAPPAAPPTPPRAASHLSNPQPEYPRASRQMGEEGTVVLRVLVSADGRAEQVEIKRSSGYDRLDQSALRAVRKWRFNPATKEGQPIAAWYDQPLNFKLDR